MPRLTAERFRRLEAVIEAALELGEDERTAFLDRSRLDGEERSRVERLVSLCESGEEDPFLEDGAVEWLGGEELRELRHPAEDLPPGTQVGPYRVERALGRGGMGAVVLASRADDEYRDEVAIKVVRRDWRAGDLERFRRERQILALLDHPSIARLLDGGTLEDGRPYLVMEHVAGEPLLVHCDRRRLDLRRRLALFLEVAEAVAHAHRHLVVHCDLKPSNILVDREGRVRLLDFGVARLLGPAAGGAETQPPRLTPDYASPEQLLGGRATTASDLYSLGVVLYELLTGCLPTTAPDGVPLGGSSPLDGRSPVPPSGAVRGERQGAGTPEAILARAVARGVSSPGALSRRLAGDLDAVVLRSLRFEPEERYGSAGELADDLRRHLDGLPVRARRGGLLYRLGKLARRHAVAATAAATLALLLLGTAAVTTVQSVRLRRALTREEAQRERAESATAFLVDSFGVDDPDALQGRSPTAAEMLERARDRAMRELTSDPGLQASLLQAIGETYRGLGLYDSAREVLREAVRSRRRLASAGWGSRSDVAASLAELADVQVSRGAFRAAGLAARETLVLLEEVHGRDAVETAPGLDLLAYVLHRSGRFAEAERYARRSLELRSAALGVDHPALVSSLRELADVLADKGPYDEAIAMARRALELQERSGASRDHAMARTLNNLANALQHQGRLEEAAELYREALEIVREELGDEHPEVASLVNNLAMVRHLAADYDGAESLYRQAWELYLQFLDASHPLVLNVMSNLAGALAQAGRDGEAVALYARVLERAETAWPSPHQRLCTLFNSYAFVLARMGREAEAERHYHAAIETCVESLGAEHEHTASARVNLAELLLAQERPAEARALAAEARRIFALALPAGHWRIAVADGVLGAALVALGEQAQGRRLLAASYGTIREAKGPEAAETREAAGRYERALGEPPEPGS